MRFMEVEQCCVFHLRLTLRRRLRRAYIRLAIGLALWAFNSYSLYSDYTLWRFVLCGAALLMAWSICETIHGQIVPLHCLKDQADVLPLTPCVQVASQKAQ